MKLTSIQALKMLEREENQGMMGRSTTLSVLEIVLKK